MGIFICAKCGCVENTALSSYWTVTKKLFPIAYDEELKEYKGKPLCSECGNLTFDEKGNNPKMVQGKWHGRFPKEQATEEYHRKANKEGLIL
jgi:hypothetical protein